MKQEMANFLDQIYDRENDSGEYGIKYFSQFLSELKKYDFTEIIDYLVIGEYNILGYILEFILSTPSLWKNYTVEDWVEVMFRLNPRPKPIGKDIEIEGYVDIHFLCKYMRINAIELFLQQDKFSNEDKKKILQYSKKILDSLFINDIDLEDLDGDYYIHKDELERLRFNLVSTGKVKPLDCTENELKKYIEKELEKYQ